MAIIPGVYQAKNAISDDSQQGSKVNSIVNAIVNPANTSLLTGFDPVIEEISNPNAGTVVTYTPQTVSGTPPLSLPNSAGQPLESWSVDVLPYQEGTGDPAPDNVRPIHGTDKLTITTAGKNLLNVSQANEVRKNGAYLFTLEYDGDSVIMHTTSVGALYVTWGLFEITPSMVGYTITRSGITSGTDSTIHFSYSTDNWATAITISSSISTYTFTTSDIGRKFGILFYNSSGADRTASNLQVEFGSTASDFVPYIAPSQTVITLPQTVYTGTIGSEGGESRDMAVDMGSLNWALHSNGAFYSTLSGGVPITQQNLNSSFICEVYPVKKTGTSGSYTSDDYVSWQGVSQSSCYMYVRDSNYQTAAEFKTAMSGKLVVYQLATPVQFPITTPTIPTPTGTATTWATAEDGTVDSMSVTYVGKA